MADSPAPTSRAGRNLPAAIASGVGLGALVLVTLFTWKWTFAVLAIAAVLIAVREFVAAFASKGVHVTRMPVVAATLAIPAAAFVWGLDSAVVLLGVAVVLVLLWRIRRGAIGYVPDVTSSIFVVAYLPFMASFAMLSLAAENGALRVVTYLLLTVSNDIGGYATGVFFGKHPIAPTISPKKSWEGFAGSLILQAVVGALAFTFMLDAPWWQGVIAGAVLTVSATSGDFAESAMKRDLGIKDMGSFLPGHGGMMDRLDSLIPNAFVSWAMFTLFLGSGLS